MQVTRILAVRHGETAWNHASRIQGHTDIELDDTGQWQARRVAQALGDEDLQALYSSDLARARDTAAPLPALHGLPVGIDEGLRERGFGDFEGLSFEQIEARWPDQALAWRRRLSFFTAKGGGELHALRTNVREALGALAAGVAHEVNNPLAVISGVAQEWQDPRAQPGPEELAQGAQLILSQTARAAQAARHLAEAAAPALDQMDWVDINAMVGQVVQLMGYDKRYRGHRLDLRCDPSVPAVCTAGTALQQVVMQLLAIAADAMQPGTDAAVLVRTGSDRGRVHVRLHAMRGD